MCLEAKSDLKIRGGAFGNVREQIVVELALCDPGKSPESSESD